MKNLRKPSKDNCKAVNLQSRRTFEPNKVKVEYEPPQKEENQPTVKIPAPKEPIFAKSENVKSKLVNSYKLTSSLDVEILPWKSCPIQAKVPQPLYPQRLQQHKQDTQFKRMLDLRINIPLVKTLEQMSSYTKAMKEFLSKKRRFGEFETIAPTIECSLFFQNKLPPKLKDPRSFIIPSNIGEFYYDRSLTYLEEKIEDVLVCVDKFIFPADFIILDFEADKKVPIILGRPFLDTSRTRIDVQKGELTMQVQDEQVTFNVLKALRSPDEVKDCFTIFEEDSLIPTKLEFNDPLEGFSSDSSYQDNDDTCLEANLEEFSSKVQFESLELSSHEYKQPNPSREESLKLDLIVLKRSLDTEKIRITNPIYDIQRVRLVPKKEGIMKNGLISLRIIMGRQICTNGRKLSKEK
ncbi:hypothetical protein EPI10_000714 [Gossypium australe]|uniref:Uncharacterized protein n=1 Tax=Gossypium australe TaxID=47621 RepID=A0A5B6V8Q3_9ROSI|nr:hypothetical protein EPI10_000714 [Gossypium australe]